MYPQSLRYFAILQYLPKTQPVINYPKSYEYKGNHLSARLYALVHDANLKVSVASANHLFQHAVQYQQATLLDPNRKITFLSMMHQSR